MRTFSAPFSKRKFVRLHTHTCTLSVRAIDNCLVTEISIVAVPINFSSENCQNTIYFRDETCSRDPIKKTSSSRACNLHKTTFVFDLKCPLA